MVRFSSVVSTRTRSWWIARTRVFCREDAQRDDEGIATSELIAPGPQPWDDAFTGIRGTPALVWDGAARIDIESDAPWWVVYTEDSDAICVEPQTAPPDAANLGIRGEHYLEALFIFSAS